MSGFGFCSEVYYCYILVFVLVSVLLLVFLGLCKDLLSVFVVLSCGVVFIFILVYLKFFLNVYLFFEFEFFCLSNFCVENIRICYNWFREYLSFVCFVVCMSF